MNVLIAIPSYNCESEIQKLIPQIEKEILSLSKNHNISLIIFDDGSNDGTIQFIKSVNVKYIHSKLRAGLGKVLVKIFSYFIKSNYDYLITMDSDGQHLPQYIPKILATMENKQADLVMASRFELTSDNFIPFDRKLLNISTSFLIHNITKWKFITDPLTGFKCYRKFVIKRIFDDYKSLKIRGYCSCLAEIVLLWKHFKSEIKIEILAHPAIYEHDDFANLKTKYAESYIKRLVRFKEVADVFVLLYDKRFI